MLSDHALVSGDERCTLSVYMIALSIAVARCRSV